MLNAAAGAGRGRLRGGWAPASPAGDVGGDLGQFRIGPRGERLGHPRIKLVLSQQALYESGLEHIDHVLAVGVGTPGGGCGPSRLPARLPVLTSPAPPRQYGAHKPSAAAFWRPFPQARRAARAR